MIAPYPAYLRVYEPLSAFPPDQRVFWEEFLTSGRAGADERERVRSAVLTVPAIPVPAEDEPGAYVLTVDGVTHLCPWQLRLRSWLAFVELRREIGEPELRALLPQPILDRVEEEREKWAAEERDRTPHVLTERWHVPLRWFVAFADDERSVHVGGDPGVRSLRYRTSMGAARRRTARALRVLRRTLENGPMQHGVEEVGRWLEEFHPRSYVELDYGGLVHLMSDATLLEDRSVGEVADGLAALSAGDGDRAAVAYATLMARWRPVQALERAN